MGFKAIIFDWDGVVVDTLQVQAKLYRAIEQAFHVQFFPQGKTDFKDFFELDWKKFYREFGFSDEEVLKIGKYYLEETRKLQSQIKPFPHIPAVLEEASKRMKVVLLTSNYKDNIIPIMKQHGIAQYFSYIHDGHNSAIKPDPAVITHTTKEIGIPPQDCIFVGDMDEEIIMAKKAGIGKVIAVTYGFHSLKRLKDTGADAIVNKPEEILQHL
ncbi:HAD family hydrolase [Candidatus Woesearchaeota archaeon]|nr:HAD family hydrolase [Candidatus Woesearchaeota archaeon]